MVTSLACSAVIFAARQRWTIRDTESIMFASGVFRLFASTCSVRRSEEGILVRSSADSARKRECSTSNRRVNADILFSELRSSFRTVARSRAMPIRVYQENPGRFALALTHADEEGNGSQALTSTPFTRWIVRWIATTAMLSAVYLLFSPHWFMEFLLSFAVLLLMNRRNLRPQ
jgi:hypothetical protein